IVAMFTMYRANAPQLYADIDRAKVLSVGLSMKDVNNALEAYIGSLYVNNFNAFGRFWQVNIMADLPVRAHLSTLQQIKLLNSKGQMVPLPSIIDFREIPGPGMVMRYNLYRAAPVNGGALPWVSTNTVISELDEVAAKTLPRSMKVEWTEL